MPLPTQRWLRRGIGGCKKSFQEINRYLMLWAAHNRWHHCKILYEALRTIHTYVRNKVLKWSSRGLVAVVPPLYRRCNAVVPAFLPPL